MHSFYFLPLFFAISQASFRLVLIHVLNKQGKKSQNNVRLEEIRASYTTIQKSGVRKI